MKMATFTEAEMAVGDPPIEYVLQPGYEKLVTVQKFLSRALAGGGTCPQMQPSQGKDSVLGQDQTDVIQLTNDGARVFCAGLDQCGALIMVSQDPTTDPNAGIAHAQSGWIRTRSLENLRHDMRMPPVDSLIVIYATPAPWADCYQRDMETLVTWGVKSVTWCQRLPQGFFGIDALGTIGVPFGRATAP